MASQIRRKRLFLLAQVLCIDLQRQWHPLLSDALVGPALELLTTLGCSSQPASALIFPKQRSGERALQAVQVVSARRRPAAPGATDDGGLRPYTFTFCMERVQSGPYKVRAITSFGPSRMQCTISERAGFLRQDPLLQWSLPVA